MRQEISDKFAIGFLRELPANEHHEQRRRLFRIHSRITSFDKAAQHRK